MFRSTNKNRKISTYILLVVVAFIGLITYYVSQRTNKTLPTTYITTSLEQETTIPEKTVIGSPVRIIIPEIKVNAILEYVGLNPEGEMEEPTEPENAAWFNRRPLPGEEGTSVIAGHFGLKDDVPAVFDKLNTLKKGDEIQVIDSQNTNHVFTVKEIRIYTPKQDATEVFSSNDGKSHLNLITCKGAWNESLKNYEERLVVFAVKSGV